MKREGVTLESILQVTDASLSHAVALFRERGLDPWQCLTAIHERIHVAIDEVAAEAKPQNKRAQDRVKEIQVFPGQPEYLQAIPPFMTRGTTACRPTEGATDEGWLDALGLGQGAGKTSDTVGHENAGVFLGPRSS